MKAEIEKQFPDKSVTIEWMILDLGSFRSTKDFAVAFKERNLPLHVLINNAGVAMLLNAPLSKFKSHSLRSIDHVCPFCLQLTLWMVMRFSSK